MSPLQISIMLRNHTVLFGTCSLYCNYTCVNTNLYYNNYSIHNVIVVLILYNLVLLIIAKMYIIYRNKV